MYIVKLLYVCTPLNLHESMAAITKPSNHCKTKTFALFSSSLSSMSSMSSMSLLSIVSTSSPLSMIDLAYTSAVVCLHHHLRQCRLCHCAFIYMFDANYIFTVIYVSSFIDLIASHISQDKSNNIEK
ncbi:hypothetical protein Bca101_021027 [Brassica carinata]